MSYPSTKSAAFQNTVQHWIETQGEVLTLFRYSHAAGSKAFEFYSDFAVWQARVEEMQPKTCVSVWGEKQLPLRGCIDEAFVAQARVLIPEATEWLLVGLEKVTYGRYSWFSYNAGMSHKELEWELREEWGERYALGIYPHYQEDGGQEMSAVIPEPDGRVITGIY